MAAGGRSSAEAQKRSRLDAPARPWGYVEYEPRSELAPYVRCLWTLIDGGPAEPASPVVPDGCCELVVNRADPVVVRGGEQGAVTVVGQLEAPLELTPTGAVDLIGIRFEPSGLHAFLGGRSVGELTGREEPVEGRLGRELRAALSVADVELALLRALRPAPALVRSAVAAIHARRGCLAIGSLAAELDVGARTLERAFAAEVGLSAKRLARIVRFRGVIDAPPGAAPISWAAVAQRSGYSDQAHLIREFRRFAGTTPARWLARERGFGDRFLPDGSVEFVQSPPARSEPNSTP